MVSYKETTKWGSYVTIVKQVFLCLLSFETQQNFPIYNFNVLS
jgi:hypothetical protein